MKRKILCFDSLVLDTFFYASLRKTLELTEKKFHQQRKRASLDEALFYISINVCYFTILMSIAEKPFGDFSFS